MYRAALPGLMSSTVIDFRVGRILGVAFIGTVGDHQRLDLATQLGLAFEQRIVSVSWAANNGAGRLVVKTAHSDVTPAPRHPALFASSPLV